MNFNKINKTFKENFFNLFMIDAAFVAISLVFLILVRLRIRSNLDKIGLLGPQLDQLGRLLQQSPEQLSQLDIVVSQIGALNKETLLLFWAIPIMAIVLWCIFQGASWFLYHKSKNVKLFFRKFVISSVIAFFLLFLLTSSTLFGGNIFEIEPSLFLLNLAAYFMIFYLLYVFYSLMSNDKRFFENFKYAFVVGIRKIFVLGALFIPLFILLLSGVFVFFSIYTAKVIGVFDFVNLWPWIVAGIVIIVIKIWYRIFFASYLERY